MVVIRVGCDCCSRAPLFVDCGEGGRKRIPLSFAVTLAGFGSPCLYPNTLGIYSCDSSPVFGAPILNKTYSLGFREMLPGFDTVPVYRSGVLTFNDICTSFGFDDPALTSCGADQRIYTHVGQTECDMPSPDPPRTCPIHYVVDAYIGLRLFLDACDIGAFESECGISANSGLYPAIVQVDGVYIVRATNTFDFLGGCTGTANYAFHGFSIGGGAVTTWIWSQINGGDWNCGVSADGSCPIPCIETSGPSTFEGTGLVDCATCGEGTGSIHIKGSTF